VLLFAIGLYNTFSIVLSSNQQEKVHKTAPFKKIKVDKEMLSTLNYRDLKRRAMDSLIDNKILTPRNIAIVDSIYPDSLCKCGTNYVDSLLQAEGND